MGRRRAHGLRIRAASQARLLRQPAPGGPGPRSDAGLRRHRSAVLLPQRRSLPGLGLACGLHPQRHPGGRGCLHPYLRAGDPGLLLRQEEDRTGQVPHPGRLQALSPHPDGLRGRPLRLQRVRRVLPDLSDQLLRPGQDREPVRHRGRRCGHGRGHPLLGHACRHLGPRPHLRHRRHPAGHHGLPHLLGAAQLQP